MKKLVRNSFAAASLWILGLSDVTAQTWQWGKRGGGPFDGANIQPHEQVVDMATDKNGNVYLLGTLSSSGAPTVDGHQVTGYGEKDIIISKFSCNGTYRWSKVIGGATNDFPGSIGTDTLGHVYVSGRAINNNGTHFDTDTVTAVGNYKTIFLMQYDTAGVFKWLRQPGPDTASSGSHSYNTSIDMVVSGNGDVYWYAMLMPGLVSGGNGWAVTTRNGYLLKYNAAGTMTGHIDPQMNIAAAALPYIHFSRTPGGRLIFAGAQDIYSGPSVFSIGGQPIAHSAFIASFSSTGQYLWKKENANYGGIYSRPAIDAQGAVYLAGGANPGDTLNGFVFANTLFPTRSSTMAFLTKMDSAGNHLWTRNASAASASALYCNVVVKNNNEVWFSGTGASVWWDSTHKLQIPLNGGYSIYAARFNGQGAILSMDSLKGAAGGQNWALTSVADRNGNLYIGGEFDNSLSVNGQSLSKDGGASDFFIAKLGSANCGCVLPAVSFNKTIVGRAITLTYSGTTNSVDSIVWNYGNGITSTRTGTGLGTAFTYSYPANGTYNVCATAYSSCGANQSCQNVTVTGVGIGVLQTGDLKVYPVPAMDFINIEGVAVGTTVTLTNLLGQQMTSIIATGHPQSLSVKAVAPGTYLLVLTGTDGLRNNIRILKQ